MVKKLSRKKARKLFKTLVGSHRKQAEAIYKLRDKILNGHMVAIDPGSNSMGYALFVSGRLHYAGSIAGKGSIGNRLKSMMNQLDGCLKELGAHHMVTVVELVRSQTGHHYLTWAAGAAVAALGSEHTLEVSTNLWKKLIGPKYKKTDENDAIAIGELVLAIAKEEE